MAVPTYDDPRWRISSHSNGEGGACVRVLKTRTRIYICDSKLGEASPVIEAPAQMAGAFLDAVRDGAEE